MGRHFNFSISMAWLLSGFAIVVGIGQSRSSLSSLRPSETASFRSTSVGQVRGERPAKGNSADAATRTDTQFVLVTRTRSDLRPGLNADSLALDEEYEDIRTVFVPSHGILVVGSLNLKGESHPIIVDAQPVDLSTDSVDPSSTTAQRPRDLLTVHWTFEEVQNRRRKYEDNIAASLNSAPSVPWPGIVERRSAERIAATNDSTKVEYDRHPGVRMTSSTSEFESEPDATKTSESSAADVELFPMMQATSTRAFLIPHFSEQSVVHRPSQTVLIARSDRVGVYVDRALYDPSGIQDVAFSQLHPKKTTFDGAAVVRPEVSSQARTAKFAEHVCRTIEARLLDDIGEMIGPIRDLDGDNRLSIVLTNLDSRTATTEPPVLGCVRDQDFQTHGNADWAGDILYLDTRLNTDEQLTALLAHELTHAAILSMRHEDSGEPVVVPPWMNEAASHWVELGYRADPFGFNQRVLRFSMSPGSCPIVADPRFLPSSIRRSGCRVSAAWFLRRFVTKPSDLQRLIRSPDAFGKTMSDVSGAPFEELFRIWSCEQSLDIASSREPDGTGSSRRLHGRNRYACKVYGTAFEFFEASDQPMSVKIHSSTDASIQTTVLSR